MEAWNQTINLSSKCPGKKTKSQSEIHFGSMEHMPPSLKNTF
jgi:hypothetical protein